VETANIIIPVERYAIVYQSPRPLAVAEPSRWPDLNRRASSSRTERAHVHWRWSQMYPQVSSLDWDVIAAYGRAWQRISAPNSLPVPDVAQPRRRAARDRATGRARTRPGES